MNPDHWQSLRALFLEAGGLVPSDQAAFLGHACRGLPVLRAQVEELLAVDGGEADRAIRTAIARAAADAIPASDPPCERP